MSGKRENMLKRVPKDEKHRNNGLPGDNPVGDMFNRFPMLNVRCVAKAMGVNQSLMQHYVNGRKQPSTKRAAEIEAYIRSLGEELKKVNL